MLIFSRRCNESLIIGDDIILKILEVKDNRVKIGIDAPGDVEVMREELLEED